MSAFHFDPPQRVLLGPGPSDVPPRVLAALARPTVGYLDASYQDLMEEVQSGLRRLFRTDNEATFAVTGSGTAAMECALSNVIEPGDRVVACVHGYFGDRMRQIAERAGAQVEVVSSPWGQPTDPARVAEALERIGGAKVVAVVHGETSTGVEQPIPEVVRVAKAAGALTVVDTVASLGGVPFATDAWGADVVYTGSQKCLSVPPGISPITFSADAVRAFESRKRPCNSWYLDLALNLTYWRRPHAYHHTGPINLTYALYEGLQIIEEQGLQARTDHTRKVAQAMWRGFEAMGLGLLVTPEHRLPTLTTVRVPDGVDEAAVRGELMARHGIEIAGGLGELAGRVWRVGLMGASCTGRNVLLLLGAMEQALQSQGAKVEVGAGVAAASVALAD